MQKIIQIEQYAKKYFFEIVSVAQFLYQNDTDHMFFLRSTSRAHTKDPRLVARKESTRQPATPLCKSRARPTASCPTGMQVLIAVQQRVPRSLFSEQHSSLRIGSLSEDQRYKKCTRHLGAGKRHPRYKGYRARTTPCRKHFAKCQNLAKYRYFAKFSFGEMRGCGAPTNTVGAFFVPRERGKHVRTRRSKQAGAPGAPD